MKLLPLLLLLFFVTVLFAHSQESDVAHLMAEAQTKQMLVERMQHSNIVVTDNQQKYDAVFYQLNLFPDVETKTLFGDVSMTATVTENGLDVAELDFLDNMKIDSVFVNGSPASYTHTDDILAVTFEGALDKEESFTTRVVYHGTPARTGFGAFGFDSHGGKPMVWSLSEPFGARNWWPCKDAPIDKADSVDITVKVRSDLIVASNGSLKEVTESGDFKTYHWQERYPITTYLVSLAIHPYSTYSDWYVNDADDSMEVQFYIFPSSLSQAKPGNAKTVDMLEAFSKIFGEYPFINEKYGHAQFLWGGGMEHQTITSLGGFSEGLIAHELAHQWWGDMVTCADFHHIWLNEGFATYSEALWWESQYGESALHQDMATKAYKGSGTIYIENPETDNIFTYSTTYAKAAWVVHMLRHVMGDEVFFDFLKIYNNDFKYSTATTEQFRELCEQVSGKDLNAYFDQWIYKEGVPSYEYLWWSEETGENDMWRVKGVVRQTQPETVFHMPIDMSIETAAERKTFVFENDQREQNFEFIVTGKPQNVLLDEDNWILKNVSEISQPEFLVQNMSLTDDNGHAVVSFKPGSTGKIYFTVQNVGVATSSASMTVTSESNDIELPVSHIDFGVVQPNEVLSNENQPFVFNVSSDAADHLAFLEFKMTFDGGSGKPYRFTIPIGSPTLLIVDDDNGADYEKYYTNTALQSAQFAAVWSVDNQGVPSLVDLQKAQSVLWFTGDDSVSTLTKDEQAVLSDYLTAGGKLLLSGQSIGYDLVEDGDEADAEFYRNVLHAEYSADILSDNSIVGQPGDIVGDRIMLRFEDLFEGAGNQKWLHALDPIAPAVSSLMYLPSRSSAGIRYEDEPSNAKLVYLAFGLEGVEGPKETSASELLTKVIDWFFIISTTDELEQNQLPTEFTLEQNYPNPFNPNTTVRFYNPEKSDMSVVIYNALGQKVRQLHDGLMDSGWHSMDWDGLSDDGMSSSSGVYFLQIQQKNSNKATTRSVKMLKLD